MRSETDLLPVHSCDAMAAKSTQAMHSCSFNDRLVSAHRCLEPAGCSLRKLLCVVVGKIERGAVGCLYNVVKLTIVCMYM